MIAAKDLTKAFFVLDVKSEEAERAIPVSAMGLYVIHKEGASEEDKPEEVGV